MAGSGSYARGEQPRSVPDPDKAAYDGMIAKQRQLNAQQEARQRRPQFGSEEYWRSHPDTLESFVPVWGSAREAIADAYEGDVVGAAANAALAVSDLSFGGYAAKGLAKGGLKLAGSNGWKATRKWMGKNGLLEPGQHGHHGIVPRGGWGEHVPDRVKNQPWNITATPSPEVHGRIHGPYKGQPQYPLPERYWRGSPDWAKEVQLIPLNRGVTAADAAAERRESGRR